MSTFVASGQKLQGEISEISKWLLKHQNCTRVTFIGQCSTKLSNGSGVAAPIDMHMKSESSGKGSQWSRSETIYLSDERSIEEVSIPNVWDMNNLPDLAVFKKQVCCMSIYTTA
jgi:hypothetical protein